MFSDDSATNVRSSTAEHMASLSLPGSVTDKSDKWLVVLNMSQVFPLTGPVLVVPGMVPMPALALALTLIIHTFYGTNIY